jgi:small subunit ribosomal protein S1
LNPGQTIKARVLELNRSDNKVIFSQKPMLSEEEFAALSKQFKVGAKLKVTVTTITPFGIYVALPKTKEGAEDIEGFIHISEASWEKIADLNGLFAPGDEIEAVLLRFDNETRRISLSIKRLTSDPFETFMEKYPVDTKVKGTVTSLVDGDVVFSFGENAEGVLKKEKIPPTTTYAEGQVVNLTIADYDKRKHRILLSPVLLEKPMGYR